MAQERGGTWYRSILFAPFQRVEWLLDAPNLGADAVMHDLEDMVPIALKGDARKVTAEAIESLRGESVGQFVRVNGWQTGQLLSDLDAIVVEGLGGVALPKTETADDVRALDRLLLELELQRNLPPGAIEIIPLPETASGLRFSFELANASPRVKRFYGVVNCTREGDTARALRIRVNRDGHEWIPVGAYVLMSVRAAGVSHILGATAMEPENLERARSLAELSAVYGANGALCIHPSHIPILNEVYSPTLEDVEHARSILGALAEALKEGESSVVVDGETATYSHARAALDVISVARAAGMSIGDIPTIELLAHPSG